MTRLLACEARKMLHSRALILLIAATALFAGMTIASPESGGPLFMIAGGDLNTMGQAIGFIGNYVDPQQVAASAVRTSLLYTPFWLPVAIVFSASIFSADFAMRGIAVSKARGVSPARTVAAKTIATFVALGACYAGSCLAALLFKAGQYGATLEGADVGLFLGSLGANVLLLCALVAQVALLFCLTRNSFASALVLLLLTAFVLVAYPASFSSAGEAPAANPLFMLSPAYYLVHTCSLNFGFVPLVAGIGYGAAATVAATAGAMAATNLKEV